MIIADLSQIAGRTYPARRRTQNLVGGASPIQATNFSMGHVTLEPNGGQRSCIVDDLPTLVWLANLAALELHTTSTR